MSLLRLAVLLVLTAFATQAGPWPRAPGEAFSAVATRMPLSGSSARLTTSVYHEFGLRGGRALILETDVSRGRTEKLLALGQVALTGPGAPVRLAVAAGGGTIGGDPALSVRVMAGRAFDVAGRPGWADLSLAGEWRPGGGARATKLDLTLGLSVTPRLKTYVQLFTYRASGGDPYVRLEGAAAVRLFGRTWLDAGLSTGLTPETDRRIKLGVWMSF